MYITKSSNLKTPDFESSATNSIFKENKTIVQAKKNSSISCFILTSCPGLSVRPMALPRDTRLYGTQREDHWVTPILGL